MKRGRPEVDSIAVNTRMQMELVRRLDEARKREDDLPNRPEMIRRILEDWLDEREKVGGE
ncbi:ribbon-helix-helix protein, CopG family [Pseudoroseicyclus sp. H15]